MSAPIRASQNGDSGCFRRRAALRGGSGDQAGSIDIELAPVQIVAVQILACEIFHIGVIDIQRRLGCRGSRVFRRHRLRAGRRC
jgi:hypothetical protein